MPGTDAGASGFCVCKVFTRRKRHWVAQPSYPTSTRGAPVPGAYAVVDTKRVVAAQMNHSRVLALLHPMCLTPLAILVAPRWPRSSIIFFLDIYPAVLTRLPTRNP